MFKKLVKNKIKVTGVITFFDLSSSSLESFKVLQEDILFDLSTSYEEMLNQFKKRGNDELQLIALNTNGINCQMSTFDIEMINHEEVLDVLPFDELLLNSKNSLALERPSKLQQLKNIFINFMFKK